MLPKVMREAWSIGRVLASIFRNFRVLVVLVVGVGMTLMGCRKGRVLLRTSNSAFTQVRGERLLQVLLGRGASPFSGDFLVPSSCILFLAVGRCGSF